MGDLRIGDLARRVGVQPSAIRYYESIGVLPEPRRVNGQRRYAPDMVRRLAFVRMAREVSCSLDEIKTMFEGLDAGAPVSAGWRALAESRIGEIEAQIARAEAVREILRESLRCDCITLDGCELIESD